MKRNLAIIIAGALATAASAQTITFCSPEFEAGVRSHLGLGTEGGVVQSQTDTITAIDLSHLGITDLRDVVYLPNVRSLNLSGNDITDVSPLLALDSLRTLDLSWNKIEHVDALAFSPSDGLQANVGYNYIQDFSFLLSPSASHLTAIGLGAQRVKDAAFLDVCQLYADFDADGTPLVHYRGYTNMEAEAQVDCGGDRAPALLDGDTHVAMLQVVTETAKVSVGNDEKGDTTYVVPVTTLTLSANESVTFETMLPDSYELRGLTPILQGNLQTEGAMMTYSASSDFNHEEYVYAYYKDSMLRGFSKLVFSRNTPTGIEGPTADGSQLKVLPTDGAGFVVTCPSGLLQSQSTLRVYSVSGILLHEERIDTSKGLNRRIQLAGPLGSIIVLVESGSRIYTQKTML